MATNGSQITAQTINTWIPAWALKTLSDRSYDRRKSAAMEIENAVRKATEEDSDSGTTSEKVHVLIKYLTSDFICSTNLHQRKGGLIGLAAAGLGLGKQISTYLSGLVPPILSCFDDPDSRVRYYACESLYNVTKSADGRLLEYFNIIFSGVGKLFADADTDVKNGAQILNELLLGFVTHHTSELDLASFVPILQTFLRMSNPYVRQLLIGWIKTLDSLERPKLLPHLPQLLDGLFSMLSDPNKEICQAADRLLSSFLAKIKQIAEHESDLFSDLLVLLSRQCLSVKHYNRLTAVTWIREFLLIAPPATLARLLEVVLEAVLHCVVDLEDDVRDNAVAANELLREFVCSRSHSSVDWNVVRETVTASLSPTPAPGAPLGSLPHRLRWLAVLLECAPECMRGRIEELTALPDLALRANETVAAQALEVMARASRVQAGYFRHTVGQLVQRFHGQSDLSPAPVTLAVCRLCVLLPPSAVVQCFAQTVLAYRDRDLRFVALMVRYLNGILFTAPELSKLRAAMVARAHPAGTEEDADGGDTDLEQVAPVALLVQVMRTWSLEPASSVALCLLAGEYRLAWGMVNVFTELDVDLDCLVELDKLVYLVETPVFLPMRLQLLESGSQFQPDLLRALYGVLMLLPQGEAFNTLHKRLAAASSMQCAMGVSDHTKHTGEKGGLSEEQVDRVLADFKTAQNLRYKMKMEVLKSQQLEETSNDAKLS